MYGQILIFSIFPLLIIFVLLFLSWLLSPRPANNLEKNSAYECGFEPFSDARVSFDVHFYIVAILFIIFDLEIIFLFPWAANLYYTEIFGFFIMLVFLIILTIGFVYEWKRGALNWVIKKNQKIVKW